MAHPELPAPVTAFVDAINTANTDAFVALFALQGRISDWGTQYQGHDKIRQWASTDAIGAGAQMAILTATTDGNVTTMTFDWRSSVFNGTSTGIFTLDDKEIVSFVIPPND